MKFGFLSLSLALSLAAFTPQAQATEAEWKCLSALQQVLTYSAEDPNRDNCVGKSYPVGAGIKADARGSFTCGFLHCNVKDPYAGTNFYAYRAFIKSRSGEIQASSLCFHVAGKTQAYLIPLSSQPNDRFNLSKLPEFVGAFQNRCRLTEKIGLAIRQNIQGELIQINQVKPSESNQDAALGNPHASHLCENALSGKVYDAAYALGLKQGPNEKLGRAVQWVDPDRFRIVQEICASVEFYRNGFKDGKQAATAQP
jgi:hypothetical protein